MFGVNLVLFQPLGIFKNGVKHNIVGIMGVNNVKGDFRLFHQPARIVPQGGELVCQLLRLRAGDPLFQFEQHDMADHLVHPAARFFWEAASISLFMLATAEGNPTYTDCATMLWPMLSSSSPSMAAMEVTFR